MNANINKEKTKGTDSNKKRKGIKYLIIFSVLSILTIATIVIWKIQSDIKDVYAPSQIEKEAKSDLPAMSDLVGQWQRTEGGYVIEIRTVDTNGILDASYYNPRPINISQSEVKDSGGMLEIFIELWDESYPGSTYNLMYDPIRDILYGTYYTPVAGQSFDVIFIRVNREQE